MSGNDSAWRSTSNAIRGDEIVAERGWPAQFERRRFIAGNFIRRGDELDIDSRGIAKTKTPTELTRK